MKDEVEKLAKDLGGELVEVAGPLPDGSGFAVMSLPLPEDHWSNRKEHPAPQMSLRCGVSDPRRSALAKEINEAGRYAYLATGMGDKDHDPDAFLQNIIVALLGYWTPDGLSPDGFANPEEPGNIDSWVRL